MEAAKKNKEQTIEKAVLFLGIQDDEGEWQDINILFDKKKIGEAHFSCENRILFLNHLDTKKWNLDKQGIGSLVIKYLGDYFEQYLEGEDLLFLVQYDERNTSREFYKKTGFLDFKQSKAFTEESKTGIYQLLDEFCEEKNIMYIFIKEEDSILEDMSD